MIFKDEYRNRKGSHAYDVEVNLDGEGGKIEIFKGVVAANRDLAARIVARDGHIIRSVNMVG